MKPATRTLIAFLALSFGSAYGAERLRIGVSNYNLSSLSMGVAHSRGFFKEEGFDSEVIRMNPNVATTAAVTGDIDFSALIGSLIGAAIKGAPLKLVACSQDRTPIVCCPGGIQIDERFARKDHRHSIVWINAGCRGPHGLKAFRC